MYMNIHHIDLAVHGDNYAERKANVREKAIDYQQQCADCDMSYEELQLWSNYFTELGTRYGLLTEFRENGIC